MPSRLAVKKWRQACLDRLGDYDFGGSGVAIVFFIGLVILVTGLFMRSRGQAEGKRFGVSVPDIISCDVGVEIPLKAGGPPKTLFSKRFAVTGRMDYLTDERGVHVPLEYKSARVRQPRLSDIFQVLTYCFLLEEEGHTVRRGRLKYPTGICDIPYGPEERKEVLQVLLEMRQAEKSPLESIPGKQDRRCRGCAYRTLCQAQC